MTISRCRLLVGIAAGAASAALPVPGVGPLGRVVLALATPRSRSALDLATVTAETFRPHIGTRFRVSGAGQNGLDVELVSVDQHESNDDATDSFSLRFQATRPLAVEQSTYHVDHGALGPFDIFLVPAGDSAVGAVINHLV